LFCCSCCLFLAQRFVSEEGAYVFITGRRQSELDAAVKQIGKNNVTGVQGDVSNLADLDRLYATVKQQKGRIDITSNSIVFSYLELSIKKLDLL
jgi:NAD(P)-dependent dehydrogenase (short-subunit alcohol dehydrogenase family)